MGFRTPHDGGRPTFALFACLSHPLGGCSFGADHLPGSGDAGFWHTAPFRPRGAVNIDFETPSWVSTSFDPTLGFPGEGPNTLPPPQWRYKPLFFPAPAPQLPGDGWMQWARATMVGTIPIHSSAPILVSSSDDYVHLCLLALAERGHQSTPIAARLQTRPSRVSALLGPDDPTALAAVGGSAYDFHTLPFQLSRPRSIRLDRFQTAAVTAELRRLREECHAVEPAPEHDGDKALLTSAQAWERTPLQMAHGHANVAYPCSIGVRMLGFIIVSARSHSIVVAPQVWRFAISNLLFSSYLKRTARSASAPIIGNSTSFSGRPLFG